jgi:hypothetical protein
LSSDKEDNEVEDHDVEVDSVEEEEELDKAILVLSASPCSLQSEI